MDCTSAIIPDLVVLCLWNEVPPFLSTTLPPESHGRSDRNVQSFSIDQSRYSAISSLGLSGPECALTKGSGMESIYRLILSKCEAV